MPMRWARHPALIILLLECKLPNFFAKAETLSPRPGRTHPAVQIYTATPYTPPNARASMAVEDLPGIIWAAANAQLPEDPSGATRTLVWHGETYSAHPGEIPTLAAGTTHRSTPATTAARPTSSISMTTLLSSTRGRETSTTQASTSAIPTSSSTPRHSGSAPGPNGDRYVAAGIGVFLGLIAVSIMAVIFWGLRRRKNRTGSFFKPSRFSLSSVTGSVRHRPHTAALPGIPERWDEKPHPGTETQEHAAPAPSVPRNSTIRPVMEEGPRGFAAFMSRRQSVERLRSRRLVSRGMWTEVRPLELQGDGNERAELDAVSPTIRASSTRRSISSESIYSGDQTPTMRPMVVTYSMTTSSSGAPGSRGGESRGDSQGESQDDIAPIPASMPSYRDRRPADLRLPTAANRFRDRRLSPFQNGLSPSPGISPLPPGQRLNVTPPNARAPWSTPTPSPNFRDRLVSPIVHYPSMSEMSGFDFQGDGSPSIRRPDDNSAVMRRKSDDDDDDGEDGWRPGRDSVFGRYELA